MRLNVSSREVKWLVALASVAFLLRIFWFATQVKVMEIEGAEYTRIAENLLSGRGFTGMIQEPELMYTPLYPFLIAAVTFITHNSEAAARAITMASGIMLPVLMYFFARRFYGMRVGWMCGTLAAVHPLLIALSSGIYTESVYLPLLAGALLCSFCAVETMNWRWACGAGTLWGFGYLDRNESVVYPLLFTLLILLAANYHGQTIRSALRPAVCLLTPFVMLALPYVFYISSHTGGLRFEGKWNINYTMSHRLYAGLSPYEAEFGVTPNLAEDGPLISPSRFAAYSPYKKDSWTVIFTTLRNGKRNLAEVSEILLLSLPLGSPILAGLALLGLIMSPWTPGRLAFEIVLLAMAGSIVFLLMTSHMVLFRYTFPLMLFMLLWAAKGLDEVRRWILESLSTFKVRQVRTATTAASVVVCGICGVMVFLAAADVRNVSEFSQTFARHLPAKNAGLWIEEHAPGYKRVMSIHPVTPYFAKADWLPLPYTDAITALKYVQLKKPDFVVLNSRYVSMVPFMAEWLEKGIPDPAAQLVYDSGADGAQRVKVYRREVEH